ncbi:MAG: response regulator [bacterium]|nr:response regulator [bacterium]
MNAPKAERHKIIVVDDEEDIVLAMKGFFNSIDRNIDALFTTNPLEVEKILDKNPTVELIITDIRMPNLSGLDLMVRIQQTNPRIKFIVMTGFSSTQTRIQSLGLGAVRYIEKPFDLEEMSEIVVDILENQRGYSGVVEQFHLADVIQLIGLSGRKSILKVNYEGVDGIVAIDNGTVIHAKTDKNSGIDAFNEMFRWPGGRFSIGSFSKCPKTIVKPWQVLVIDAARIADELNAGGIEKPQSEEVVSSPPQSVTQAPVVNEEMVIDSALSALDELLPMEPPPQRVSSEQSYGKFAYPPPLSEETIKAKENSPRVIRVAEEKKPNVKAEPLQVKPPAQKAMSLPESPDGIDQMIEPIRTTILALWPEKTERLFARELRCEGLPPQLLDRLEIHLTTGVENSVMQLEREVDISDEHVRKTFTELRRHLRESRVLTQEAWLQFAGQVARDTVAALRDPAAALGEAAVVPTSLLLRFYEHQRLDWIDPFLRPALSSASEHGSVPQLVVAEAKRLLTTMSPEQRWEFVLRQLFRIMEIGAWLGWREGFLPVPIVCDALQQMGETRLASDIEMIAAVGVREVTIAQIEAVRAKEQHRANLISN